MPIYYSVSVLRNDDIQEFDSKWDEILLSMTKIPLDDILEGLYKLRIRESEKLKTVWNANGQCSKGDNSSFRHDMNKRAQSTQPNPSPRSSTLQNEKMHREPEVLEAEAQVGKWLDCRARITSKELAQFHSVRNGILQNACSTSPRMDAD